MGSEEGGVARPGGSVRRRDNGEEVHAIAGEQWLPFFCSFLGPYSNGCSGIQFLFFFFKQQEGCTDAVALGILTVNKVFCISWEVLTSSDSCCFKRRL